MKLKEKALVVKGEVVDTIHIIHFDNMQEAVSLLKEEKALSLLNRMYQLETLDNARHAFLAGGKKEKERLLECALTFIKGKE